MTFKVSENQCRLGLHVSKCLVLSFPQCAITEVDGYRFFGEILWYYSPYILTMVLAGSFSMGTWPSFQSVSSGSEN